MDLLWMCLLTPQQETIMARPRPVYRRSAPLRGRLRSGSLRSPPLRRPRRGLGGRKKSNLQKQFYTPYFNPECECLVVLILNTRHKIKGHYFVSVGTMDTILVHPREVFVWQSWQAHMQS